MKRESSCGLLTLLWQQALVTVPAMQTEVKADDKKLVGVAMPTKDLQRWNQDGENMKKELEEAGFEVDLQYASNDVATQVSQVENHDLQRHAISLLSLPLMEAVWANR